MPDKFVKIRPAETGFNRRYGVDFSLDAFDKSIKKAANSGGKAYLDTAYKNEFSRLYKKAYANFFDGKLAAPLDFGQMIYDFESGIMTPYRSLCQKEPKPAPGRYGGWTTVGYLQSVQQYLKDLPEDNESFIKQRYSRQELPLSDVKAQFEALKASGNPTVGKLAVLDCYVNAIREVNKGRSFLQMLANLGNHFSEKRLIKNFRSYVEQKTGVPYASGASNPVVSERMKIASSSVTKNAKEAVKNVLESTLSKSSAAVDGRERVEVKHEGRESHQKTADRIRDHALSNTKNTKIR